MKAFTYVVGLAGGAALVVIGQALWSHDFKYVPFAIIAGVAHVLYLVAV